MKPPAFLLTGGLIGFLPDSLHTGSILPGGPGLQLQLAFFLIQLLFHGFPVIAGKDQAFFPTATDAVFLGIRVGTAADAYPQAFLLAGIANGGFAGHIPQICQAPGYGQMIGGIGYFPAAFPPPYGIVGKPDLFNGDLNGGGGRTGNPHGKGGLWTAVQGPGAINQMLLIFATAVQQMEIDLHGDDDPVAQIIQKQLTGGILLRWQRRAEQFRRTAKINEHIGVPFYLADRRISASSLPT